MRLSSLIVTMIVGSFAIAEPIPKQRQLCGTTISDEQIVAAEARFEAERVVSTTGFHSGRKPIDVYFHVIARDKTIEGGWVPNKQIKDQMNVLNKALRPVGVQFKLKHTERILNATWFDEFGLWNEKDVKTALHRGGKDDLNVYTSGLTNSWGLLGYSSFPSDYKTFPKLDGIVILHTTVPGGTAETYNLGHVGHWLGLYHTFQGGCGGDGDFVADTPEEFWPTYDCPTDNSKDTCPDAAGIDPYRNFMDYSIDSCMTEWTRGQGKRIHDQIATFRGIH